MALVAGLMLARRPSSYNRAADRSCLTWEANGSRIPPRQRPPATGRRTGPGWLRNREALRDLPRAGDFWRSRVRAGRGLELCRGLSPVVLHRV